MTDLKPCPFCGSKPEWSSHRNYKAAVYYIRCPNPDCMSAETKHYWNEEDAIKAWNRRVEQKSCLNAYWLGEKRRENE